MGRSCAHRPKWNHEDVDEAVSVGDAARKVQATFFSLLQSRSRMAANPGRPEAECSVIRAICVPSSPPYDSGSARGVRSGKPVKSQQCLQKGLHLIPHASDQGTAFFAFSRVSASACRACCVLTSCFQQGSFFLVGHFHHRPSLRVELLAQTHLARHREASLRFRPPAT
jgi:hypothetical protein